MDYLDAMREARDKELSLWTMKYNAEDDTWRYYRNNWLIDCKNAKELDSEIEHLNALRDRAAMKAAYEAAQQVHWSNPLATLDKPRDLKWIDCPASEPATVRYIDKIVVDDPLQCARAEALAWFNRVIQEDKKLADAVVKDAGLYGMGMAKTVCTGDGVALMSIAHPEPCGLFPEKDETQAERIARITREMCGG